MGDSSVDPKIIKKTQDTLGKVIKKPPMSEKILSRPTVQYMYDVLISVMKTTGKMKGLFTETELNFDNIKGNKEDKLLFFQKAIDYVSLVTGKPVAVKPSKILAGHEPERTNEFLQILAEATRKNIDNDDYVKRVLKADDTSKPSSKKESSRSKDKDKESSKGESSKASGDHREKEHSSSDRHQSKDRSSKDRSDRGKSRDSEAVNGEKDSRAKTEDKERSERHRNRDKDRDDKSRDKDRDDKSRDKDRDDKSRDKDRDRDRRDKTKDRDERSKDRDERSKDKGDKSKDREGRSKDRDERSKDKGDRSKDKDEEDDEQPQRLQRPSSAKGSRRLQAKGDEPTKEATRPSQQSRAVRPSSARPAPPKPKKTEIVHEEPVMTGLQRPNVIIDRRQDSDDDDDAFVAKEEDISLPPDPIVTKGDDEVEGENDEEHGGLVKKLLESKKEQETVQTKKTEIERSSGVGDASRRKDRERIQKEIEKLQASIQTTTRNVHPLGRLLDLVQENLDAMQKEKEVWVEEHRQNVIELQQQQSVSDSSLEPLKAELREVDAAINDQLDMIAAVKNNLFQNDAKIAKMIGTITKS